jgi:hypothetical protein
VIDSSKSYLGPGIETLDVNGGIATIENNVFVEHEGTNDDFIRLFPNSGSTFRFNTVVNTSPIPSSTTAIGCDGMTDMTSNIIAYNSTLPLGCAVRNTLFDLPAMQSVPEADGNRFADIGTFFRGFGNEDFHLSTESPAIGIGEPGLVTSDIEGNSRPPPAGSSPDAGAFESPE